MKHFGIFITDLESERFLSASNDQIATWLFLHAFCSKQTNGGTITEAASLPDRFWNRHGIEKDILDQPSPLWSWAGDSLSVEPYDIHGETLYLKKSKGGKEGNAIRWKDHENKSLVRTPNRTPNPPDQTRPDLTIPLFALDGASSTPSPVKILWNASDGFSGITEKDRLEWSEAFPAVNIDRQLAAASRWLKDNPAKRKKLVGKFITGWLSRAQERGGDVPSNPCSQAPVGTIITGGRAYKS